MVAFAVCRMAFGGTPLNEAPTVVKRIRSLTPLHDEEVATDREGVLSWGGVPVVAVADMVGPPHGANARARPLHVVDVRLAAGSLRPRDRDGVIRADIPTRPRLLLEIPVPGGRRPITVTARGVDGLRLPTTVGRRGADPAGPAVPSPRLIPLPLLDTVREVIVNAPSEEGGGVQ